MKVVAQTHVGYFWEDVSVPFSRMKWKNLAGKPYIWHVVERLERCKKIDEVVLFAQDTPENKEVVDLAKKWNLNLHYYGKPHNWDTTLKWYNSLNADVVIYGNFSPLIDPESLYSITDYFIEKGLDYLETEQTKPLHMFKINIWPKLYEIEKDFDKIKGVWSNLIKERCDLFKSDTFGRLEELKILDENPLKWFPLLKKIYKRFYIPDQIINLKELLLEYEKDSCFDFTPETQIEIEVTNDCNLKCIMCPRTEKMSRKIGYMDFDLFKKIINETEALSIHFSGFGEPLLHPRIIDMVTYAKEKELEVGLWTNGLELTEDFSKEILEREFLDYIIFSLDAATRETYFKIKGVDVFDKVRENILKFLEIKSNILRDKPKCYMSRKPLVGNQILKMKDNEAEIEQFMEEWDYVGRIKKIINYQTRIQKGEAVEAEVWKMLYEKFPPVEHAIIGHFNNYCGLIEDRSVVDVTPLKRYSCKQLQGGISILWDGKVVLCRQDFNGRYSLGNLKDQNLEEILEGERLKDIWQAHKDGEYEKLSLCKDCKEWYYNLYE